MAYIVFTGPTRRRSAADLGATPSFHRLLSRPVALGKPLGTHWGPLGDPLGTLGDLLGTSWGPWGTLGDPSGIPWGPLGDLRGRLGVPWARLGDPLGTLTRSFGRFRCLLGILWGQLGAPRGSRRLPKGVQEACWGPLGSILEASKVFTKQFAAICKNLQIYCKVLQKLMSGAIEIDENQFQKH